MIKRLLDDLNQAIKEVEEPVWGTRSEVDEAYNEGLVAGLRTAVDILNTYNHERRS